MLLLAGLHLLYLHVPVITTHLRTGRGTGALWGSAAPGLDAALCNCHCVPIITTSALTRVARARPDMVGSETSHILYFLPVSLAGCLSAD